MSKVKKQFSKLVFYFGTMGCAKTANALMQAYKLKEKGLRVLILKPAIDTRDGKAILKSRIGLSSSALTYGESSNLIDLLSKKRYDYLIIDECQFSTAEQIEQLRYLCDKKNKYIFCYGLKSDFKTQLFEGSKRLFEIADKFEEIENYCSCGRRASVNARFIDGKLVKEGEQVLIGGNNLYKPLCYDCWKNNRY